MPRMTHAELLAYQARQHVAKCEMVVHDATNTRESDLHAFIVADCKRRGWIAFHGSMAHSTFRTPGEPDFVILANDGRVLLVECKTARGKLSAEQVGIHHWAEMLGHRVYVVRSEREWMEAANG